MQISTELDGSKVAFTNGTNRFIASAGANWAVVDTGHLISLVGSANVPYDIVAVFPPGTMGNVMEDRWELTIVGVISEPTNAAASYAICVDFLAATNMWDPQYGDTQTLQLLKRNFRIVDALAGAIGNSHQTVTVNEAGDTVSTQTKTNHAIKATAEAGAGAYVATFSLPETRAEGDICKIRFDLPAGSTNPTVKIYSGTPAGTQIFEWAHDGVVTAIACECIYDGTNWYLHNAQFIQ